MVHTRTMKSWAKVLVVFAALICLPAAANPYAVVDRVVDQSAGTVTYHYADGHKMVAQDTAEGRLSVTFRTDGSRLDSEIEYKDGRAKTYYYAADGETVTLERERSLQGAERSRRFQAGQPGPWYPGRTGSPQGATASR